MEGVVVAAAVQGVEVGVAEIAVATNRYVILADNHVN